MSVGTGTGLDAQLGIAIEDSYGAVKAPDAFVEFNSVSIAPDVRTLKSSPLGSGGFQRASRVKTFIVGGAGDIELDLVTKGLGPVFQLMFGKVDVQQVGSTDEYVHTFTPDVAGLRGLSATVQVGVPATSGTIHPFTYIGGKVTAWEISAAMDDIAKLKVTMDFKSLTESALGVPSYAVGAEPFTFLEGSLTIDGDPVGIVTGVTLSGTNALNTERRSFGNVKHEPLKNAMWEYTGTFESEFESLDAYTAWTTGASLVDLELTFEAGEIAEGVPYKLVVTIPTIKYTGEAPSVTGPDIVPQNLAFEALLNDEGDPIISLDYHTTDTGS